MPRSLWLTVFSALLGASALDADGAPGPCQVAVLRNDFTIQFTRSEDAGPATKLWMCSGEGYVEIPNDQIERFEQGESAVPQASAEPASVPEATTRLPVKDTIQNLIAGAALRHRLDPDFVTSVVKAESGFNPTAVSPKGAQGLMQLMPRTAATLGIENAFDPAANLEGGTKYLRQLLEKYDDDAVKALAAYNAGPQCVEQYGGVPPYAETRAYIVRIINDYNHKKQQKQAQSIAVSAGK